MGSKRVESRHFAAAVVVAATFLRVPCAATVDSV